MTSIRIIQTDWQQHQPELTQLRHQVFVNEQQVPVTLEIDEYDPHIWHWLAFEQDRAIATARMRHNGHIGRMAVLQAYRNRGIGRQLLDACITLARVQDLRQVSLSAQCHAQGFYQKSGFSQTGPVFHDAGIEHQDMLLLLRNDYKLGIDSHRFALRNPENIILSLCQQARFHINILSDTLPQNLYGSEEFISAISALARQGRQSQIRILIKDSNALRGIRHPLIELSQRLSTAIELRSFDSNASQDQPEFITVDKIALAVIDQPLEAGPWASFHQPPSCQKYDMRFSQLWEYAKRLTL